MPERLLQNIADCLALFQRAELIEIAGRDMAAPFHLALIRHELPRDDIEEGGFALAVCTDQPDMLTPEQPEGCIVQNLPRTESVRDMLNIQNTHLQHSVFSFLLIIP